jgi:hypothetical protein
VSKFVREVFAAFDSADALETAVFALETHGFDRAAFSSWQAKRPFSKNSDTAISR